MHRRQELLNQLLSVKYATKNNLFTRDAQRLDGSTVQIVRYFKRWEKIGFVRQIPTLEKPISKVREVFWTITADGASSIGRRDEYKYFEPKAINNAQHESAKIDIALSFLKCYPKYGIEFDYNYNLNGLRPDILVRMENGKEHIFLVEIERKRKPNRTFKEKILRYERVLKNVKKLKLPDTLKVLIVYAHSSFNTFLRPQQYNQNKEFIDLQEKQLIEIIKYCDKLPNRYRFITLDKFTQIEKPIWYTNKGTKVPLIY